MRSALILAGGTSRRFGSPKAFAEFRGQPVIARVADAVARRADELLVSVADSEQGARIRALLPDATPVVDIRHGRGPVEGLRRGLRLAKGEVVLVAPCDAPLLRTALYDLLLQALGNQDAAVPRLQTFDPVRAVYRREPALRVLEARGARIPSPSALVDRLDVAFVGHEDLRRADPDLESFLDMNVPNDLERAAKRAAP